MQARVYIETTIASYLTARSSRDLVVAAHQEITRDWWDARRFAFDLYASDLVIQGEEGDAALASRRIELLSDITVLGLNEDILRLSRDLVSKGPTR